MRGGQHRRRTIAAAVVGALAVHGLLLWWLSGRLGSSEPRPGGDVSQVTPAASADPAVIALVEQVPNGASTAAHEPGAPVDSVLGTHAESADHPGRSSQASLASDRDLPGRERASVGGGAAGGPDSFTGRRDRENFQTQPWNDPEHNRLPREMTDDHARQPQSPESLVRRPERGFDDISDTRVRAREGADTTTPGGGSDDSPGGVGLPLEQRDWRDADPMFDGPDGKAAPERVAGRTGARGQAVLEVGATATEAARRGRVRDTHHSGAASNELDPAPIEMSAARAGGDQTGVAGPRARPGLSARGAGRSGTGASTARGDGEGGAVRARRRDLFFRRMYQRMDRYVEFPKELALALRQGQVVVRFEMSAAGEVSGLSVIKHSGHEAFDRQVVNAVKRAAPFGAVPDAVLKGRDRITVMVPYTFKNSLIRP